MCELQVDNRLLKLLRERDRGGGTQGEHWELLTQSDHDEREMDV